LAEKAAEQHERYLQKSHHAPATLGVGVTPREAWLRAES